ncbi:MAG: mechanosensitive ion channel domain-containing protein [Candidatus Woesearchaeota archaeon]
MWEFIIRIESYFYNLILAAVILLAGLTLGLILRRVLLKVLHQFELDIFVKKLGKNYSLEKRISDLAAYLIYLLSIYLFLRQLGITSAIFLVFFVLIALILMIIIFFGLRDFFPNLLSGLKVRYRGLGKIGKKIKYGDIEGRIKKRGWLEIEIETEKGENIHISTSLFLKSKK